MTNDRIINKIIKLLALAEGKGATPGEASAAAAQAQRLMHKYNVSTLQLVQDEQEDITEMRFQEPSWRLRSWRSTLAWGVAASNYCQAIVVGGSNQRGRERMAYIIFVGTPTNIAIVNYMFLYLAREIDRLAKEAERPAHIQPDRFRNAFRFGAVETVVSRLKKAKVKIREQETTSTALVKIDDHQRQIALFVKNNIRTHNVNVGHTSQEGAEAGREAGRRIALNDALNGKTQGLLS
jgi:hypothetical protein